MGAKQSQTLLEISKGEAYQNFVTSIRAYQTLKTYRYRLVQNVSRVRDTCDLDKIIAADLDNRKQAEAYIKRFIDELKTRGVSEYYIKSSFAVIRHFYDMNDCILNWRRLTRFVIPATTSATSEEASDERRSLQRVVYNLMDYFWPYS